MKNILVIDNRDSFVYNIVEYLRENGGVQLSVIRDNGEAQIESIKWSEYDGVVLSPGAGLPEEYALMSAFLKSNGSKHIPVLGVCLGLQALVCCTGGALKQLPMPKHGHSSHLKIINSEHFMVQNIKENSPIARYHSWVIDEEQLPLEWEIIAKDEEGNIMILSHKHNPWVATQFHPESIITIEGRKMIEAWILSLN